MSKNFPEVPVEINCNRGACGRGFVGRTGTGMCQICVGLAQHDNGIIYSTWLLLDTCSTNGVGNNPDMLKNIREILEEKRLNLLTNGGNKAFN